MAAPPSCSRFAPLNPDEMLGSNTPGAAPTQASPTTPKASAHPSRAPSPTPSLQPAELQEEYEFNGTTYATLEEAIEAAGHGLNVPAALATFMTNCIKEISRRDITKVYNILGNKMYEHKNRHAKTLDELEQKIRDSDNDKDVLISDLTHRLDQAEADSEVLNNNNDALRFVNKTLNNRLNNLEKHVTQLDAQFRALSLSVPALGTTTASEPAAAPASTS
jgi:chromosome segregation ATPase